MKGLFNKLRPSFLFKKKPLGKLKHYVFYKIIDAAEGHFLYILHCINTNARIGVTIAELIADKTLLYGLHPLQACYIGLEYAQYLRKKENWPLAMEAKKQTHARFLEPRYGHYILSLKRSLRLSFIYTQYHTRDRAHGSTDHRLI